MLKLCHRCDSALAGRVSMRVLILNISPTKIQVDIAIESTCR